MNKEYEVFERYQQNNFSFWFPKVEHCGIRVPRSIVIPVPAELAVHFYMEQPEDQDVIEAFVKEKVEPEINAAKLHQFFIKNGTFSNKFNASMSCLARADLLTNAIIEINYGSLCNDAGGLEEIIIRERIPYNPAKTPCIYNGLPFRTEFRVFYDFDDRKVLYTVNYWDYDYVYPHLYDMTDRIIFQHQRQAMETQYHAFEERAAQAVASAMQNVEGLDGAWSVDLLLDDKDELWLIDMAVAEQSAYWDRRPDHEAKAKAK